MTARAATRQLQEKMPRRGLSFKEERKLPLQRQVIHAICKGVYRGGCACAEAVDKPPCDGMEHTARYIIDLVRHHDSKAREGG